jgi:hypothetical protein
VSLLHQCLLCHPSLLPLVVVHVMVAQRLVQMAPLPCSAVVLQGWVGVAAEEGMGLLKAPLPT